jgi:hypothetical protein
VLTPAGLVIALLLSAPALYDVTQGSLGLAPALLRLLAAFGLVAVGTAVLRRVMAPPPPQPAQPGDEVATANPGRRRDDA